MTEGCIRKQKVGYCGHPQCPHPDKTEHGYECVDIVDNYCEVGEDCVPECPYSFPKEQAVYANDAFRMWYR